jgi:hypothetical protein
VQPASRNSSIIKILLSQNTVKRNNTRVDYGATLTIDPGVVLHGNGNHLQVFGILSAVGSTSAKITFTNIRIDPATSNPEAQPFSIIALNAYFKGSSIYAPLGNGGYGGLTLEDCYVENPSSYFYIWYPSRSCSIKRNVFLGSALAYPALFSVGTSSTNKVLIQDNVFYQQGKAVQNWASLNSSMTIVTGNSFLQTNFPTLILPSGGYTTANMIATNNYWGTLDTNVINKMIFDRNDASDSANYIAYIPFLSAPNTNAAQVPLPTIQVQPQAQTAFLGDTVLFNVVATGLGPLAYQWQLGATNLPSQTNSDLILASVGYDQVGDYTVTTRNFTGDQVTSQPAHLAVNPRPAAILSGPSNQVAAVGQTVTFTSSAIGTPPLSFQWLLNGTNLAFATNDVLSITNVQPTNAGIYTVMVTNTWGSDTR